MARKHQQRDDEPVHIPVGFCFEPDSRRRAERRADRGDAEALKGQAEESHGPGEPAQPPVNPLGPSRQRDEPVPPSKQSDQAAPPSGGGPAESVARPGKRNRRGFLRSIVAFFVAIFTLITTTILVLGLVGAAAYVTLNFYVSGHEVMVPDIRGVTPVEALERLGPNGLFLELERREYNEVVPRDAIAGQFPSPGMKVKSGTPVRVILSDGAVRVRAPKLIGMSEINAGVAARSLPQADLDVGPNAVNYSNKVRKGDVIAQDPPPGTPILRGSKIKLLVSAGPKSASYSMPDLRNKTLHEARAALSALQLTLGPIREADQAGMERGIVLAQQPGPGKRVAPGASVVLTVASGLEEGSEPRPER